MDPDDRWTRRGIEARLRAVHAAMLNIGARDDCYRAWRDRVALAYPARYGAAAIVWDRDRPGLAAADIYAPGLMPRPAELASLVGAAALTPAMDRLEATIHASTDPPAIGRLLDRLGFERETETLYAIDFP